MLGFGITEVRFAGSVDADSEIECVLNEERKPENISNSQSSQAATRQHNSDKVSLSIHHPSMISDSKALLSEAKGENTLGTATSHSCPFSTIHSPSAKT